MTIDACGHVPEVERPDETHELLLRFFGRAERAKRAAHATSGTIPAAGAEAA